MKKLGYLFTAAIVLASCGEGSTPSTVQELVAQGDMEALMAKKADISEQQRLLTDDLRILDSVITSRYGNERLPLITTITANVANFDHFLELQGDVKTKQNVLVYPEMQGNLQKVYVTEGQKVVKGQLLASIDDGGMGSQVDQLITQAELAKTTYERQMRLWEQKIGSEIQYLQAKTQYEASQNAVKQAESQLGKSVIRAPFSGIVDDVIKDQGTVVSPGPGSEVFRIVNLDNMYIEVDVPENYLDGIQKGKEAIVYFPVLGDTVNSVIRQTGNFIKPGNRSFTVEISVPNKEGVIKPNLTAKVRLNDYSNPEAILVPQNIISENAEGQQYVYVAISSDKENEAMVKRRIITTGKTQGKMVEVLSGIENGDYLVKEGARIVKEGQRVKIINDQPNE